MVTQQPVSTDGAIVQVTETLVLMKVDPFDPSEQPSFPVTIEPGQDMIPPDTVRSLYSNYRDIQVIKGHVPLGYLEYLKVVEHLFKTHLGTTR